MGLPTRLRAPSGQVTPSARLPAVTRQPPLFSPCRPRLHQPPGERQSGLRNERQLCFPRDPGGAVTAARGGGTKPVTPKMRTDALRGPGARRRKAKAIKSKSTVTGRYAWAHFPPPPGFPPFGNPPSGHPPTYRIPKAGGTPLMGGWKRHHGPRLGLRVSASHA